MTGVAAAKLRRHMSNMNVIGQLYFCKTEICLTEKSTNGAIVAPTPVAMNCQSRMSLYSPHGWRTRDCKHIYSIIQHNVLNRVLIIYNSSLHDSLHIQNSASNPFITRTGEFHTINTRITTAFQVLLALYNWLNAFHGELGDGHDDDNRSTGHYNCSTGCNIVYFKHNGEIYGPKYNIMFYYIFKATWMRIKVES